MAHPRSRGENVIDDGPGRPDSGLIPAHAGKTTYRAGVQFTARAHPRSRGENRPSQAGTGRYHGSSPLTRGKQPTYRYCPATSRLIPAHAGKTGSVLSFYAGGGAHPRSRGENGLPLTRGSRLTGSSPLTRGKLLVGQYVGSRDGLIPAHAGKTINTWGGANTMRAHPRSRGENVQAVTPEQIDAGSSPLTRGKPVRRAAPTSCAGLIPAHAGKTRRTGRRPSRQWAHPRSRGENGHRLPRPRLLPGSSPLTRGKRWVSSV